MNDPELMKLLEDLTIVFNPTSHEIGRRALVILERLKNPKPTGETVRVRAGVYWDDVTKEWLVFGYLRGYDCDGETITKFHDLKVNDEITNQADPKGYRYRRWHKTLYGGPVNHIEADIPLPHIPVVEARVVEGGEA